MPTVKNAPQWNGRRIAKEEDAHDLEQRSALYEFKHRMTRKDAEHRAHHEYKLDKHREAAAYHLQGLKASQASGSTEEGHKHGLMYQLHMKALGLDPMSAVPHEIQSLADKQDKFYKFKPHRGDLFLLQEEPETGEVSKSELAKGDVVKFPGNPAPAVDQGKKAKVTKLTPDIQIYPHGAAAGAAAPAPTNAKQVSAAVNPQKPSNHTMDSIAAGVGHVLGGECSACAFDDGDDYGHAVHALANHFKVHPDVIHAELRNHTGRAMDDDEDLGHVMIEMTRHLARHFGVKKTPKPRR